MLGPFFWVKNFEFNAIIWSYMVHVCLMTERLQKDFVGENPSGEGYSDSFIYVCLVHFLGVKNFQNFKI